MTSGQLRDHLYRRCQEMAASAARSEYEQHAARYRKQKRAVPPLCSGEGRRWVELFNMWYRGEISEECIKETLLYGYFYDCSPVATFASYIIISSGYPSKLKWAQS